MKDNRHHIILSLECQFLTICLKSYILRKTCGFAQIVQKTGPKLKFCFMCHFRKKYFRFCANCAKLIAFHAQKFAKIFFAKIAQILRKRFSHFLETLNTEFDRKINVLNHPFGGSRFENQSF